MEMCISQRCSLIVVCVTEPTLVHVEPSEIVKLQKQFDGLETEFKQIEQRQLQYVQKTSGTINGVGGIPSAIRYLTRILPCLLCLFVSAYVAELKVAETKIENMEKIPEQAEQQLMLERARLVTAMPPFYETLGSSICYLLL